MEFGCTSEVEWKEMEKKNMDVSITGIKGYEYQYKVTVLISLMLKDNNFELFVEKVDSEDALLLAGEEDQNKRIEIQVKREGCNLDISKLVKWLCHFKKRRSNNNLLQRLVEHKDNIILFVTHARCSDETVFIKTEIGNFKEHESISISNAWRNKLISTLKNEKFGQTTLMKERESFCNSQSQQIDSNDKLSEIFKQCIIWEEFSDEKVDDIVNSILNKKYNVAQSKTEQVYLKLLECVRLGRDSGNDILKNLHSIVQDNKVGKPLIDSNYYSRPEEQILIKYLNENNILLLTGISQCGKTEIAKKISINFFNDGFDYRIFDRIDDVKRFLETNISDNKVIILEDPFGHVNPKPDHQSSFRKIQNLLPNKANHHKLIITCRIEILLTIFNTTSIDNCKINNHKWHDLTIRDDSIINNYWKKFGSITSVPKSVIDIVSKGIIRSPKEHLLQIGELIYLSHEENLKLIGKKYDELMHIARRSSREIAIDINRTNRDASEILSIISICSTAICSVSFEDIAYIFSNNQPPMSMLPQNAIFPIITGEIQPIFPEYSKEIELSNSSIKAIEYLEERQFISVNNNKILFKHPNYYEAGRYLFFSISESKQKRHIEFYQKSISCLNTKNAFLASNLFSFIYHQVKDSLKQNIISVAFRSQYSIFPSVVDNTLIFLVSIIKDLDERQKKEVTQLIQFGERRNSHIFWNKDNIPFISNERSFSYFKSELDSEFNEENIKKAGKDISNKILPQVKEGWMYILHLKNGNKTSLEELKILIQYNESFIREKLAYVIFENHDLLNKEFINELFEDEHPSVIFSIIRASLLNWFNLRNELKDFVSNLITLSLQK